MPSKKLRVIPLGGLGEIGMNCMIFEWDSALVLIDCGIQFPDASYTGVELLAPDFSYLKPRLKNILGVVVTHGHDDHIGAIPFLARDTELDVYCTPFPKGLLLQKLSEMADTKEIRFHDVRPREVFSVGPFKFDPIPVAHSIIESLAFVVETPVGNVVHSGDFKHDPNEFSGQIFGFGPFKEWSKKGISLLLSDSTNAERAGHTLSEKDITVSFKKVFSKQTGRIIVALFASNIHRVENLLWLAHKMGKKVAFAGRSMHAYTRLAHEQGSLKIPSDTIILLENTGLYPDDEVVVLATGSQAEPQSALVRISQGIHKEFELRSGDLVILSSRFIPGNEKAITTMINHLYRADADVLYESIHQIHVSGHGFQDELLMLLKAVKPNYFVPIHGEYRHLAKHGHLAIREAEIPKENVLVVEDGQVLELSREGLVRAEKLELRNTIIVDNFFVSGEPALFSQRNNLSRTGIVFAVMIRSAPEGALAVPPRVTSHGLLFRKGVNPEEVHEGAVSLLETLYDASSKQEDPQDFLRLELRRFFKRYVSHKPVVIPMLVDIGS